MLFTIRLFKCKQYLNKIHSIQCVQRFIHTSGPNLVWEPHRKGHRRYIPKSLSLKQRWENIKNVGPSLKKEFNLWTEEVKEKFRMDAPIARPGDSDYIYRFNDPGILDNFIVTCDKDHNEGFSECELLINENKKGVFKGYLNTTLPKDGAIVRTGYCNFTSKRARKSFYRPTYMEWYQYNYLLMRVRGDGRSYMINIACEGDYDLAWNDMWNYILFTRGGPYWQIAKIPFSKFYYASKGRIQDKQEPVPLSRITAFGITMADKIPGPFHLEIDYVGVYFDPSHKETFAYEMYKVPEYVVI